MFATVSFLTRFDEEVGQFLLLNSNNAVLYRISKHFESLKLHLKQGYLNLTAKIDPLTV